MLKIIFIYLLALTANAEVYLNEFNPNSLQEITNKRNNQAFILVLWSIDCPPCFEELSNIEKLKTKFSKKNMVLVATDGLEHSDKIKKVLSNYQLNHLDNWVFADYLIEKLRYKIDENWYGELPRAYFYDNNHNRNSHSGTLSQTKLENWLKEK